jgi:hypothetical protein
MRSYRALLLVGGFVAALPAAAQVPGNIGVGLTSPAGSASTGVGQTGATFLQLPIGARELALAGSSTANAAGITAFYWNTAAAAELKGVTGGISRSNLYDSGLEHVYGAIAFPAFGSSVFGLSINYFTSGEIVVTTESFPDGGDPEAGGTTQWNGFAGGLHFARRMTDRLAVGAAAKYISEGMNLAKATWIGTDFSTVFRTGLYGTTIGATITNLGNTSRLKGSAVTTSIASARDVFPISRPTEVQYNTSDMPLPTSVNFALSTDVGGGAESLLWNESDMGLLVNTSFSKSNDSPIQPAIGVEYRFRQLLFLRVGKKFYNEDRAPWDASSGLGAGFGLSFPVMNRRMNFDWGILHYGALPSTQTVTLQFGY